MLDIILATILVNPAPHPVDRLGHNLLKLAHCESSNQTDAVSRSGKYRGLFQFDLPTWESVGGTGDPAKATRAEQMTRARTLYLNRGWKPWPQCAPKLGLKDQRSNI